MSHCPLGGREVKNQSRRQLCTCKLQKLRCNSIFSQSSSIMFGLPHRKAYFCVFFPAFNHVEPEPYLISKDVEKQACYLTKIYLNGENYISADQRDFKNQFRTPLTETRWSGKSGAIKKSGLITDRVVWYCCQNWYFKIKIKIKTSNNPRKLLPIHELEGRECLSFSDPFLWKLVSFCFDNKAISDTQPFPMLVPLLDWRVNYKLIEFDVKYPFLLQQWYFSFELDPLCCCTNLRKDFFN